MTVATGQAYIDRDDAILGGEPIVKRTRMPVRAIVETWRMRIAPEDIPTHLPHLTLAQVFDALSNFADHQAKIRGILSGTGCPMISSIRDHKTRESNIHQPTWFYMFDADRKLNFPS
jgi:uncharacterized protein (DUF433 family)